VVLLKRALSVAAMRASITRIVFHYYRVNKKQCNSREIPYTHFPFNFALVSIYIYICTCRRARLSICLIKLARDAASLAAVNSTIIILRLLIISLSQLGY